VVGWNVVGTAGFSAGDASYTSLAIDPTTGTPYLGYQDGGNALKATVQKFVAGTGWTVVGTAGFSAGTALRTSLAIDPTTGTPFLGYRDGANSNKATVQKFVAGTGWTVVGTAGFSAGTVSYPSLAIDPTTGTPFLGYRDDANSNKATVQKFVAGTGWTVVGTAGFSAGTADYPSLAIDPTTGTPFLGYRDVVNSLKATVQKFVAGTGWTVVGTAGFSAGTVSYTSLAIDPTTGTPFLGYRDIGNGNKATVQKFVAGTGWTVVGTAGFSAGGADYTSLAIEPTTGTPFLGYRDDVNGNKATVQKFVAGTGWTVVGTAGFSAGTVTYTSLAIDPTTGTPFLGNQDGGNGNKATVQRYG